MKRSLIILFLFSVVVANAQTEKEKLSKTITYFHTSLVSRNTVVIGDYLDDSLSYGHSNGWIETKTDLINNLNKGVIRYHRMAFDSLVITINGSVAHVRFVADIVATLRGNKSTHHLKVLEVWVKKEENWLLFARQAVK